MSDVKKRPQPAALRLANMGRALRRRSREYTKALDRYHAGDMASSAPYVEACESELEQAALKFARAAYDCNNGFWTDLITS
jgi:hypothetical protein